LDWDAQLVQDLLPCFGTHGLQLSGEFLFINAKGAISPGPMEDQSLCPQGCATHGAGERRLVANCLREALDELEQPLCLARRHRPSPAVPRSPPIFERLPERGRDARPLDPRAGLETRPEPGLHDDRPPLPAFTCSVHDLVSRDVELSR